MDSVNAFRINAGTLSFFPTEILQHILSFTQGNDLAALKQTNSHLNKFVYGNVLLHRDIYLGQLDWPPNVKDLEDFDWQGELQMTVKLEKLLQSRNSIQHKLPHLDFVAPRVSTMLRKCTQPDSCNSSTIASLNSLFNNRDNLEAFLCQSNLYHRSRFQVQEYTHSTSPLLRQYSAKLHVLYGIPIEVPRRYRFENAYPYAVSIVYDLSRYTENGTLWGPFMDNGRADVDWEKMEAIMIVIGRNIERSSEKRNKGIFQHWVWGWKDAVPESFRDLNKGQLLVKSAMGRKLERRERNEKDPYNVEGMWLRVVCFLDYAQLHGYNFLTPPQLAGDPLPPLSASEACILISMELQVTKISPPGPLDGQALPVVHFEGKSRALMMPDDPHAQSTIKGRVSLTKEGEVRWSTVSIYPGNEERWKSEGIQVGGPNSARGVLGHWFDRTYDPEGPAGPSYFWKVTNDVPSGDDNESLAGSITYSEFPSDDSDDDDDDGSYHQEDDNVDGDGDEKEEDDPMAEDAKDPEAS